MSRLKSNLMALQTLCKMGVSHNRGWGMVRDLVLLKHRGLNNDIGGKTSENTATHTAHHVLINLSIEKEAFIQLL